MKNKIYILLAISAIATLSFTFASKNSKVADVKTQHASETPAGGLLSEDKF